MRILLLMLAFWFASIPAGSTDVPTEDDLKEALQAYHDSSVLNLRAGSFVHARRAYIIARKLFAGDASKLAPIALTYARAAAFYEDRSALQRYEQALDLYVEAYGTDNEILIPPLIDAADEALTRNQPEMAYAWYNKARELLADIHAGQKMERARVNLGIARLFLRSEQLGKALEYAELSAKLIHDLPQDQNAAAASLQYWLGEIQIANDNHDQAFAFFSQALQLLQQRDPASPLLVTLHSRLVELNHSLGNQAQAIEHCLFAQKLSYTHHDGPIWNPIYDPSGRVSKSKERGLGKIRASFRKGSDCRLQDIEIHELVGITETEAQRLLSQIYVAPLILRGRISPSDLKTLSTFAVRLN